MAEEQEQEQETSEYIVTWTDGIDFIRVPVVVDGENRVFRTTAPVAPSRDDCTFLGWQSQRNGGELV